MPAVRPIGCAPRVECGLVCRFVDDGLSVDVPVLVVSGTLGHVVEQDVIASHQVVTQGIAANLRILFGRMADKVLIPWEDDRHKWKPRLARPKTTRRKIVDKGPVQFL